MDMRLHFVNKELYIDCAQFLLFYVENKEMKVTTELRNQISNVYINKNEIHKIGNDHLRQFPRTGFDWFQRDRVINRFVIRGCTILTIIKRFYTKKSAPERFIISIHR